MAKGVDVNQLLTYSVCPMLQMWLSLS